MESNPCSKCPLGKNGFGPSTLLCFGENENTDGNAWLCVVTEKPILFNSGLKDALLNTFTRNGISPDCIFWTSVIKCADKKDTSAEHCVNWLEWEIDNKKFPLVVTVGEKPLKQIYRIPQHFSNIGEVTARSTKTGTPYWHIHVCDIDELNKLPERNFFHDWAINKIHEVCKGEYPKQPFKNTSYTYATTKEQIDDWFDAYKDYEVAALDTEAGGKDPLGYAIALDEYSPHSFLICATVSIVPGESLFFHSSVAEQDVIDHFVKRLRDYKLVLHNAFYDLRIIREKWNVNLWDNFYLDTMLTDHVLREWDRSRGLKRLTNLFLRDLEDYDKPIEEYFTSRKIKKQFRDYADIPIETIFNYACMDADATIRLFYLYKEWLEKDGFWDLAINHVSKTGRVYGEDMHYGWGFDTSYHNKLKIELESRREEALSVIRNHPYYQLLCKYREAEFQVQGKKFYDPETQMVYESSECYESAPDSVSLVDPETGKTHKKKFVHPLYDAKGNPSKSTSAGKPVKSNTYTIEDLIVNPAHDAVKREIFYGKDFFSFVPEHFTDTGNEPSVSEIALLYLKKKHGEKKGVKALIDAFIMLQKCNKQLSTYVTPAHNHYNNNRFKHGWVREDGLVHPIYMLAGSEDGEGGTSSGRPSAKHPVMTAIPSRGKHGKAVKKMFVARPRDVYGNVIDTTEPWDVLQLDYSQLELRILADFSQDPFMVDAYVHNKDLHTELACERFNKSLEWFSERLSDDTHPEYELAVSLRSNTKTSWFAYVYGAGATKLVQTLAKQGVWISVEEMQAAIDDLKRRLPRVEALRQSVMQQAPVIKTPFGRRRTTLNYFSTNAQLAEKAGRQLFNFLIQSTGADFCSKGMYVAADWVKQERKTNGLRSYLMGNVFDSTVWAVPKSEVDYVAYHVKQKMENPGLPWQPNIPYRVDVEHGPNYGELSKWHWKQ